jgi:hypothetical protein
MILGTAVVHTPAVAAAVGVAVIVRTQLTIHDPARVAEPYSVWLVGVAALLPPCRYSERFKQGRPATSFWRML